jgi:hypothetical protein
MAGLGRSSPSWLAIVPSNSLYLLRSVDVDSSSGRWVAVFKQVGRDTGSNQSVGR